MFDVPVVDFGSRNHFAFPTEVLNPVSILESIIRITIKFLFMFLFLIFLFLAAASLSDGGVVLRYINLSFRCTLRVIVPSLPGQPSLVRLLQVMVR